MTTLKPLPCPVCGKKPKVSAHEYAYGKWKAICEQMTKCTDHCIYAEAQSKADAIRRWNRMVSK